MSWLIDKIRGWFCKHDWELLNTSRVWSRSNKDDNFPIGMEWTYRCKKCCKKKVIKNY